jgi:hypothetical protein
MNPIAGEETSISERIGKPFDKRKGIWKLWSNAHDSGMMEIDFSRFEYFQLLIWNSDVIRL